MDYATFVEYGSIVLMAMAMLVSATNIIVQVIKNLIPKVPTNYLAVAVAFIISLLAVIILCSAMGLPILWYYIVGAIVLGLFVAYAAMFGFDKFKDAWEKVKGIKSN